MANAERLVESGDAGPELQRIDDFFRRVTGGSGLLDTNMYDILMVSPQAMAALRLLRQWCEESCDRLSIDSETGEVILLPASEPSTSRLPAP